MMARRTRTAALALLALVAAGGLLTRAARGSDDAPVPLPLRSVEVVRVRAQPGGAEIQLARSTDAPNVAVRVDPNGGGDVATIAEALARAKSGEVALAAGTYQVDALELPPGVSLAGGFDPQTWAHLPQLNPTVLEPRDPGSARALVRLTSGSRLSGLTVRGAGVCVELAGDGAVVQGVGLSHCGTGLLARSWARGLVTYSTFVHDQVGALVEPGSEVAVQDSVFQANDVALLHDAQPAAAVPATGDVRDPLAFPLPSTNNLFFQNRIGVSGPPLQVSYESDPGLVRDEATIAADDPARRDDVRVEEPAAPIDDQEPVRLVSETFGRPGGAVFSAVLVESTLAPGDRAFLLDAADGNAPVAELASGPQGWVRIPPTTQVALQVISNGDARFDGSVTAYALAESDDEDLTLRADADPERQAMVGSTDGGPLGITGAADAHARWYEAVAPTPAPAAISAQEERELRSLEGRLAPLTRAGSSGDAVVLDDDGGWVPLDGAFRPGGNPGATYTQRLSGPPRAERSINALLSEVGATSSGLPRRILIDAETLEPATQNLRTRPATITAFRLNDGPRTELRPATLEGIVAGVELRLEPDPSRADEAIAYARSTLGSEAGPSELTLRRVADYYGAVVTEVETDDTRREVALGEWLVALLAVERGGAATAPAALAEGDCPSADACRAHVPQLPDVAPAFPADAASLRVEPSQARTSGPWVAVKAGTAPLNLALDGLLTSSTPLPAVGLAPNSGAAELVYTVLPTRTATTTVTLQRLEGRATSRLTITLRGPMGVRTLTREPGTTTRAIDDVLGELPLVAGEPLEVRVRGATTLVGALTLRAGAALPTALSAPLTAADPALTATGGSFGPGGWTTDAALSALTTTRTADETGARVHVRVAGLAPCGTGTICPSVRLLALGWGGEQLRVDQDGDAVALTVGERTQRLPLPRAAEFPLELQLRRTPGATIAQLSVGDARSSLVLPASGAAPSILSLELGSLEPDSPTMQGVTFRHLRVLPASAGRTLPVRTARLTSGRRDAQQLVVFASTDPAAVRARTAPRTVLPIASLRPTQQPTITLTGLKNGVPVTLAAAVVGASGEVSALSDLRTVVPQADSEAPPPAAIPTFATATVRAASASGLVQTSGARSVPASRLSLTLGDQLVLDPSQSIPPGTPDLLVSWSIGRDQNVATEPVAQHAYTSPGTYRPTLRLLRADGSLQTVAAPSVTVRPTGETTASILLDPPDAQLAVGGTLALRGAVRGEALTQLPRSWRARLDPGDGAAAIDSTEELRAALSGPTAPPLPLRYVRAGSYSLTLTLDDETGARRATVRQTVLVGPLAKPAGLRLEVEPQQLSGTGTVRARAGELPAGSTLLSWDFGDALSGEERSQLPSAPGLGTYAAPAPLTTTPLQVLGDLPVFLRVRSATGQVSLSRSSLFVDSPGASFQLQRSLLFGSVSAGFADRQLALSRVGLDGTRTYLADVQVDRAGFVLLPVSPAQAGQAVAAVRDRDRSEVLAVDGTAQLRTTLPLTVAPSPGGFSWSARSADPEASATLEAHFSADASVRVADPGAGPALTRGILVTDLAAGATLGVDGATPALLQDGEPVLTFDLAGTPRLARGTTLRAVTAPTFQQPGVQVRRGDDALAVLLLRPDGPVRSEAAGEGWVLRADGAWSVSIDAATQTSIRVGDRLVLAARDARGQLSKDLTTLVVRADDLARGRAPAFGVASDGTRALQGLDQPGQTFQSNSTQPVFFGVADPGATVRIVTHSEAQEYTVTADSTGAWKLVPAQPLPEGDHTVEVTAGGIVRTMPLVVDLTPPAAPEVTGLSGRTLTGLAEPGATVAVFDLGTDQLGAVVADADGRFRFDGADRFTTVLLKAVDPSGNVSTPTRFQAADAAALSAGGASWRTAVGVALAVGGLLGLALLIRAARRSPLGVR